MAEQVNFYRGVMAEQLTLYHRLRRRLGMSYTSFDPALVMPTKFERLAAYNGEVAHGLVHTAETDARMAELQAEFNDWISTRGEG